MFSKFRSLIFKIDPEIAHNLAIKSLRLNLTPNLRDENGPRMGFFISFFGVNETKELIKEKIK